MMNILRSIWLLSSLVFFLGDGLSARSNFAQDSLLLKEASDTLIWGTQYESGRNGREASFLGSNEWGFFIINKAQRIPILEHYDFEGQLLQEKELELPKINNQESELESILVMDNSLILFTSVFDKDKGELIAYANHINQYLNFEDLPLEVDRIENARSRKSFDFEFKTAPAQQLFLIYHGSSELKQSNDQLSFKVYTSNLDLAWTKTLQLPYEEELFQIADYTIDNEGKVFMISGLGQLDESNRRLEFGVRSARYVLMSYNPFLNKLKEYDVSLKDKWIMGISLDFTEDDKLVIAGFYSKDQFFTIGGSFYFRLDHQTGEMLAGGLQAFDDDLLKQFMSDRRADRASELDRFQLKNMFVRPDGGAVLIAEQHYVNQRFMNDINTGRQQISYDYIYNDAVVMRLDSLGRTKWSSRIAKEQISTNDGGPYSSFVALDNGEDLSVFFNDHPDNFALLEENPQARLKSFRSFGKSVIVECRFNDLGQHTRKNLGSSKIEEAYFQPKSAEVLDSHRLLIYADFRRYFNYGLFIAP